MESLLLNDNLNIVADNLGNAIREEQAKANRVKAEQGIRYYNYNHDILQNRIFYIDGNGELQEDLYASNVKIPHGFFTELVDQKVQYLLSKPVQLEVEDMEFKKKLDEYYNEDMQLFLQEMVEGVSLKGIEFAFARTSSEDKLCFQVADSLKTFTVLDNDNNVAAIVRHYDKEIQQGNKKVKVTFAERWTNKDVAYFVAENNFRFEVQNKPNNPSVHVLAADNNGKVVAGRSYNKIPFQKLTNNKNELTDLEPIKALIDDYDLMACFLSNNLQDFAEAIYVVKGFKGDNLDALRQNIKSRKTVGVDSDGDVAIRTIEIPVAARESKLQIDKESIYKFGMGFDSSQISSGVGQITNVAIQSGYSLLNMKCNKAEVRLRVLIRWINDLVVDDINRRYNSKYKADDIKIIMERETMTDQKENAEIKRIDAETKSIEIQTLLAAGSRLDDESVLRLICEEYDLDFDEVIAMIEQESYTQGLADDTEPLEVDLIE